MVLLLAVFMAGCKKDTYTGAIQGVCPVVVSTDPMNKAVDVVLAKVISATFNTAMKPSTISNTTFTIAQGSTNIAGTVAPTANNAVFTFTPTVALLPFTTYTGTITNSVRDTLGSAMVSAYVWTFTTIPQVTLSSNPVAGGTTVGAGTFAQGSVVTVTATPNAGFAFTNWTNNGVVASASPSYQFTMAGNIALVANFAPVVAGKFALTLSSLPLAGGTTAGSGLYNASSSVTATATPNAGYSFINWTNAGVIASTSSSYTFRLTQNQTLVANFQLIPSSQFAVILSSNPPSGGTTTGSGTYNAGTSVTVTATPNAGYNFTNWTNGATIASTSSSYTFALNANTTLVANFAVNTYTLTVTAVNGTVVKNPDQPTYNNGTSVQLTATPNSGYTFTSWSGDATGSTNPLTVVMTANKNITANFSAGVVAAPLFTSIFGAFGGTAGITNQGINTVVNGAIGTTAVATKVTGFDDGLTGDVYTETPLNVGLVTGGIYASPPYPGTAPKAAIATQALADATAFYISISPANKPGGTDPGAGELGGLTLAPGVYKSASGTFNISNGNLTLDAKGDPNATWIFQTAAALTVGIAGPTGGKSVILTNGALAQNVYWYVGSAATINGAGGGVMVGTIISTAGVTFSTATAGNVLPQVVLNGRAISLVASVTMVNTTINIP
ncbi:MAG TPA: ice-binding family protein [Mucilaginibacter sp.]